MKIKIDKLSEELAYFINDNHDSDIIFSMLPDVMPYLSAFYRDPECGVATRLTYGQQFGQHEGIFIFEFHCLAIDKIRISDEAL